MPLFTWTENLSVKVKELDDQHKKLISLVNDLHDAMRAGQGKAALGAILDELIKYTEYHFSAEEAIMSKYGYEEFTGHKALHTKLTTQVHDLKSKYDAGNLSITLDVMNFLKDWLNNHILDTDKRYSAFLNGKGVK
ncbi:MAG: bacteriohemerythrin [Ignavibacteria bacterium]|nr:bacteriohemerythrin [Ignavibacteria bacterium]